jgi:hypothetical protein
MHNFKQDAEFTIVQGGQQFAGLLVFLTDVHALGLQAAQSLTLTTALYWGPNDKTRSASPPSTAANQRAVATNAVPTMAEDIGSDRTRDQADRVDSERRRHADERIGFREEQLAEDEAGPPCCKAGNRTIRS